MGTAEVTASQHAAKRLRENEKKWGKEVLEPGWSLIPNIILVKQHALGLDPIDINIILQIGKHWWRAGETPFPSQKTLAREMNVDLSTVKRHLMRLRSDGFIDWKPRERPDGGRMSNAYSFSGLIAKIRPYAVEEMKARVEAAAQRNARANRKRVSQHVVPKDVAND